MLIIRVLSEEGGGHEPRTMMQNASKTFSLRDERASACLPGIVLHEQLPVLVFFEDVCLAGEPGCFVVPISCISCRGMIDIEQVASRMACCRTVRSYVHASQARTARDAC